jgi:hypothetical protein
MINGCTSHSPAVGKHTDECYNLQIPGFAGLVELDRVTGLGM